jgi:hypothetical protein
VCDVGRCAGRGEDGWGWWGIGVAQKESQRELEEVVEGRWKECDNEDTEKEQS